MNDKRYLHDLTIGPRIDPTSLYRSRDGMYADDMLVAALNGFDFFTWLEANPGSVEDIAAHFRFHRRPVDVMTTLFVAMALLERHGPELRVTEMAREHLVSSSPWFLGPYFPKVGDRPIATDLLEILRDDRPARFAGRKDEADWHRAMESESFAEEFIATMDCRGLLMAPALAKNLDLRGSRRLLDIAGGSGIYACAFAAHFPGLTASVMEKSPVDRIASRAIAARGYQNRVTVFTGDMLHDAFPDGYDVHLFSNVLHDWDVPVAQRLVRASAEALPSGGHVIVHEALLDADKTGPLPIAAYSVLLMHVTQGRCYAVSEIEAWLREAGFETPRTVPSAAGRAALIARKK